jgi:hypothetical protein
VVDAPKEIQVEGGHLCTNAEIASNGENYLVVWPPGYAVLLNRQGDVIARLPTLGSFSRLSVASDGRDYLIVGGNGPQYQLVALPVSRRGDVGSSRALGAASLSSLALASNGANYLAVMTLTAGLHVQLLGSDGAPLGSAIDRVTSANAYAARAAWSGSDYVISYLEYTAIATSGTLRIAKVDTVAGAIQPGAVATQLLPASLSTPQDLAALNGALFLVWNQDTMIVSTLAPLADFVPERELLGSPISMASEMQWLPVAIAADPGVVVGWREYSRERGMLLRATLLDVNARPLTPPVDVGELDSYSLFRLAFDGGILIATWNTHGTLYARRFTRALLPIDSAPVVVVQKNVGASHSLAAGGGVALIIWTSSTSYASGNFEDIYGAILRTTSSDTAVSPLTIAELPLSDHAVSAAWNGSEFLVAWAHSRGYPPTQGLFPNPPDDVLALRVSPRGEMLDTAPRTIASLNQSVDITSSASNGRNFFVAWHTDPYARNITAIFGKSVANDGSVATGEPIQLSPPDDKPGNVTIMSRNDGYLVAWPRGVPNANPYSYSLGFRITDSRGEGGPITVLPPIEGATYGFGVAGALGATPTTIIVAYSRVAYEPQFAGVPRIFARTVIPFAGRRRATSF